MELKSYRTVKGTPDVNLDELGKTNVAGMDVEIIDPVEVRIYRARVPAHMRVCVLRDVCVRACARACVSIIS